MKLYSYRKKDPVTNIETYFEIEINLVVLFYFILGLVIGWWLL